MSYPAAFQKSRRRVGRYPAAQRELAGLSAQMLNVCRPIPSHVPHPIAVLNERRYGSRIEVLSSIASAGPVELGSGVGCEVLATDGALPRPLADARSDD